MRAHRNASAVGNREACIPSLRGLRGLWGSFMPGKKLGSSGRNVKHPRPHAHAAAPPIHTHAHPIAVVQGDKCRGGHVAKQAHARSALSALSARACPGMPCLPGRACPGMPSEIGRNKEFLAAKNVKICGFSCILERS